MAAGYASVEDYARSLDYARTINVLHASVVGIVASIVDEKFPVSAEVRVERVRNLLVAADQVCDQRGWGR